MLRPKKKRIRKVPPTPQLSATVPDQGPFQNTTILATNHQVFLFANCSYEQSPLCLLHMQPQQLLLEIC